MKNDDGTVRATITVPKLEGPVTLQQLHDHLFGAISALKADGWVNVAIDAFPDDCNVMVFYVDRPETREENAV